MIPISIIILTYNRADKLREAVQSVLHQTWGDFELLIIDDGSSDHTQDIVRDIKDPRLRYHYQQNKKMAAARNTGIDLASGEYIGFLDDDDLYYPNNLEKHMKLFNAYPDIDLSVGGALFSNPDGNSVEFQPWLHYGECPSLLECLTGFPIWIGSTLMRRSSLDNLETFFDPEFGFGADTDFYARFLAVGNKMKWLTEIISIYRLHNYDSDYVLFRYKNHKKILDKFMQDPVISGPLGKQKHDIYSRFHVGYACNAYANSLTHFAQKSLLQSLLYAEITVIKEILIEEVSKYAANPIYVKDPDEFISFVMDNLPNPLNGLSGEIAKLLTSIKKQKNR